MHEATFDRSHARCCPHAFLARRARFGPIRISGEIRIVVTDAATKAPIELARVLLDGPVITSRIDRQEGEVLFTDVPDGIYRARIVKRGYQTLTSDSFEVLDGSSVTVSVALVARQRQLKVIGTRRA